MENYRVLELGCGVGANPAAMACSLPASSFLGLDLSPRQSGQSQAMNREAGLTYIALDAGDQAELSTCLAEIAARGQLGKSGRNVDLYLGFILE